MVTVDPAGLASAAQRITAVLGELAAGDPVHPPLGADPATVGAAARLSVAGSTLAGVLGAQAAALAATAEQLVAVAAGFAATDQTNAAKIATLDAGRDGPGVSGWAPPSPPVPPDARPPLPPPPPLPGETIAAAVHGGDPGAGDAFIAAWTRVAAAADDAAGVVRSLADTLPDSWDSPVSTPAVRAHLNRYAEALAGSGTRAKTLVAQASRHVEETVAARADIPSPDRFAALRRQLTAVAQANAATGGAYAIPLAQLHAQKAAMDAQAVAGFGAFHAATDTTTAGEVDLDGDGLPDAGDESGVDDPAAADGAGEPGEPTGAVTPEMAGQLAAMLPGMIPAVLGAAGGLVGGAVSMIGKMPEALAQAGTQAVGAATQSLSSLMAPAVDDLSADAGDLAPLDDPVSGDALGGGGGATTPAAGGLPSTPPSVAPSTGAPPAPPSTPAGALGPSGAPPAGASGMGMMPMPLGGMMPGAGAGQGGQDRPLRPKDVVVPPVPHAESVTGKISAERIAVSATAGDPGEPPPPGDDDNSPGAIVRRITTAPGDGQ